MLTARRIVVLAAALAALAAPARAAAQAMTLSLEPSTVVFNGQTVASGQTTPAAAGSSVVVEREVGGSWETLAGATTDAAGAYSVAFEPPGGGLVRARVESSGVTSDAVALAVRPLAVVRKRPGRAFLGAPLRLVVRPVSYAARAYVTVFQHGRVVGRTRARVREGTLVARVPTPGVGRFRVRIRLPASGDIAERTLETTMRASARRLSVGARGADVRALHRRLAQLRFHTPGARSSFGWATFDAVIAFQKAMRLPRSGTVATSTWQALGRGRVLKPRHARPFLHLEVDKTRQILMIVRRGRVSGILPVSTGATGNTPEGAFRILWKAPATGTWLGAGTLYRTMTFHGNFAIHGWASVPSYPASHGCVRVPIWAADWLYRQSPVGERVFVYR